MKEVKTKSNVSLAQVVSDDDVVGHFVTNSEDTFEAIRGEFERYIFDGHAEQLYNVEYDIVWARYVLVLVDEGFEESKYFERQLPELRHLSDNSYLEELFGDYNVISRAICNSEEDARIVIETFENYKPRTPGREIPLIYRVEHSDENVPVDAIVLILVDDSEFESDLYFKED